jgi:hypothetical protein
VAKGVPPERIFTNRPQQIVQIYQFAFTKRSRRADLMAPCRIDSLAANEIQRN